MNMKQRNVKNKIYQDSKALICDMIKVFENAIKFNVVGTTWYDEANRLLNIIQCLIKNQTLTTTFKPAKELIPKLSMCKLCNNVLLAQQNKNENIIKCILCLTDLSQRAKYFICHNHNDNLPIYCKKCASIYCTRCNKV